VYDWEAFKIGDDQYLIAAEFSIPDTQQSSTTSTTTTSTTSSSSGVAVTTSGVIYRWQGAEKFVAVHSLNTPPSTDWETFTTDAGEVYLVCANGQAGVSQLFKVKMV